MIWLTASAPGLSLSHSLSPCFSWDVPASPLLLSFPLSLRLTLFFYVFFLSLPLSSHLSCLVPPNTTSSHIPRLLVQGRTPRPSWAPPGTETSFLRAGGDLGMEAECSCLGCREGAERESQGPPPRPGSEGSALLRTQAHEGCCLDSVSCGCPSSYSVLCLESVEFPGGESTSPVFTGSHRRRQWADKYRSFGIQGNLTWKGWKLS